MFSLEKMHCSLKVLTTFCKEISEIISTIVMKECYKYEDKEIQHINSKKLRSFNIVWLN